MRNHQKVVFFTKFKEIEPHFQLQENINLTKSITRSNFFFNFISNFMKNRPIVMFFKIMLNSKQIFNFKKHQNLPVSEKISYFLQSQQPSHMSKIYVISNTKKKKKIILRCLITILLIATLHLLAKGEYPSLLEEWQGNISK